MHEDAKFLELVSGACERARRVTRWQGEFPAQGTVEEISFVAGLTMAYGGNDQAAREKFSFQIFAALDTLRSAARERVQ